MRRRCCCNNNCKLYPGFTYTKDGLTVTFTNTSTTDFPPMTYHWDFGDGSTSSVTNPVHTYAEPGFYTVTLTVTNAISCVRTISQPIELETLVPCPQCITGFAPKQVAVQIPSGTSLRGCQFCLNLAGIYVLTQTGFCAWAYSEVLGLCNVCTSSPNIKTLRLFIELRVVNGFNGPAIELSVGFVYSPANTDDNCGASQGTYRKPVTFPIDCSIPHTLPIGIFNSDKGGTVCLHGGPTASVFL